jgi:hypothetical protein
MKMVSLINEQAGRLYEKSELMKWDLPEFSKEQLKQHPSPYFFMFSTSNEDQGMKKINLTLFPSQTTSVFALEIKLQKIAPDVLHKALSLLRAKNCQILSSTGVCQQKDACYFGIYFSSPCEFKKEEFNGELKKVPEVINVELLHYSLNGCAALD